MNMTMKKVIDEMKNTKKILIKSNNSYQEFYANCFLAPTLGFNINAHGYNSAKNIIWDNIKTNNGTIKIDFDCKGNICLTKYVDRIDNIDYRFKYNVESPNFEVNINIPKTGRFDISFIDKKLIIKHKNIGMLDSLDKSFKRIVLKSTDNTKTYLITIKENKDVQVAVYSKDGSLITSDSYQNMLINNPKSALDTLGVPEIIKQIINESLLREATDINLAIVTNDFEDYLLNYLKGIKDELILKGLINRFESLKVLIENRPKIENIGFQRIKK